MLSQSPEIQILLRAVENKFNFRTRTTSDFECLSEAIYNSRNTHISPSTLKRLWGYVKYRYVPRESTLDILANYVGFSSYNVFCEKNGAIMESASLFISNKQLDSLCMECGTVIAVCWDPDRYVEFEKITDLCYRVAVSKNSKLKAGDNCCISSFIDGHSLLVTNIIRDDVKLKAYIAGKHKGIRIIEVRGKNHE